MPRRAKRDCEDNPLEKGVHAKDMKRLAEETLQLFFRDKKWFCGGSIPDRELLSDDSVKTILRTSFNDESMLFIHDHCLTRVPQPASYNETSVPWTVHYLISLLREMKQLGFPKEFQPGLVLLFFKFCKGVKIPSPPIL